MSPLVIIMILKLVSTMTPAATYVLHSFQFLFRFSCRSWLRFNCACLFLRYQYYYNPQTQQYVYWDSEKQAYVPAPVENNAASNDNASGKETKEPKEKKEKPKSKTAQQVSWDLFSKLIKRSSLSSL